MKFYAKKKKRTSIFRLRKSCQNRTAHEILCKKTKTNVYFSTEKELSKQDGTILREKNVMQKKTHV